MVYKVVFESEQAKLQSYKVIGRGIWHLEETVTGFKTPFVSICCQAVFTEGGEKALFRQTFKV